MREHAAPDTAQIRDHGLGQGTQSSNRGGCQQTHVYIQSVRRNEYINTIQLPEIRQILFPPGRYLCEPMCQSQSEQKKLFSVKYEKVYNFIISIITDIRHYICGTQF